MLLLRKSEPRTVHVRLAKRVSRSISGRRRLSQASNSESCPEAFTLVSSVGTVTPGSACASQCSGTSTRAGAQDPRGSLWPSKFSAMRRVCGTCRKTVKQLTSGCTGGGRPTPRGGALGNTLKVGRCVCVLTASCPRSMSSYRQVNQHPNDDVRNIRIDLWCTCLQFTTPQAQRKRSLALARALAIRRLRCQEGDHRNRDTK